ncbi:ATP-binding protein [Limimaricola soesokkakensis]|uniref:ATP-binding protein n=1 Tax=Limimaricola soesokkakensis TaxID=1343159 RepID=UPI003517D9DA
MNPSLRHFLHWPVRLCADKAISLSIIVDELISNALKHAFHGREIGHVFVRLEADDVANELILTVRDRGIGLGNPAAGPTSGALGHLRKRFDASVPRIRPLSRHLSAVKGGPRISSRVGSGKGQELGQHGPALR